MIPRRVALAWLQVVLVGVCLYSLVLVLAGRTAGSLFAGLGFGPGDVYASVVGGVRLHEPGADLAVCVAAASALTGRPVSGRVVVCGEVGLAGEIRPAPRGQDRLREAAKLGFSRAVIPRGNAPKAGQRHFEGLEIIAVDRLSDALDQAGA